MAMVMLAGVGGLGEPLTAFNDLLPGPAVPVQYSVTPPIHTVVQNPGSVKGQFLDWTNQCKAANMLKFLADDPDADLKAIDSQIAAGQCSVDGYRNFPGVGYPPQDLTTGMAKLATDRAALVAKKAVAAAAKKIADDEAANKAAKDKLDVVSTGTDTGKILGMDSKTFMLVAAAGLVLFMMEKKG